MSSIVPQASTNSSMSADKLELYRWAVQDPETHVAVLSRMYAAIRPGRKPRVLREDFAGTSAEAVAWVQLGGGREAIAVDLDGPTLQWAEQRARRLLGERAAAVQFVCDDVLAIQPPQVAAADIISALNFSVLYFQQRAKLVEYLAHARECLATDGLFVMNLFGGAGATRAMTDRRQVVPSSRTGEGPLPAPFEYHWQQRGFNPVTGRMNCHIHFDVPATPGEKPLSLRDAFVYEWRLWTLPELVDVLREVGFADVQVWRHTYTPSNTAAPVFLGPVTDFPAADTWLAYVIGVR